MMGIIMEFHLDGTRQGMFVQDEIKKARLNLLTSQIFFYNTEATLLKTLQAN